jgi:hypothetical protein
MVTYDIKLMTIVVDRAQRLLKAHGVRQDRMTTLMDLHFAHEQYPLDLARMCTGPDSDFLHDILGIRCHMDRRACVLVDCFVPRYALGYHPTREAR